MHLQYTLREMFEKRPARRHSCSFLFSVFVICTKTVVDAEWTTFFFFEMLTIKYDRMALVNIEKLNFKRLQCNVGFSYLFAEVVLQLTGLVCRFFAYHIGDHIKFLPLVT